MRRLRPIILTLFVIVLVAASFGAGLTVDHVWGAPAPPVAVAKSDEPSTFKIFWEAWDLVRKHYVDQKALDDTTMTYGAVSGMIDSLGDTGHTRFFTPKELQEEQDALSGQLQGIGAQLSVRDGQPIIVAPIPGSPAQQAGLRPGDVIVKVNGTDVVGLSIGQIVSQIRGPAGTQVTLSVLHKGDSLLTEVTITRAQITVPSVTWAMVPGTKVAHMLVSQFADHASDDLKKSISEAKGAGAESIVLDLRNNPGGIRDEAIAVASQFLKNGNVLIEQDANGNRRNYPVKSGGVATDIPLAILINEGSASSSEIVAGALQDYQRGPLIGMKTFGTGTVLSPFKLSDGSAVLIGTQQWLTPNGRQIWHQGIVPDIEVQVTAPGGFPVLPQEETSMSADQFQSRNDAQLLRAVQELTGAQSAVPAQQGS